MMSLVGDKRDPLVIEAERFLILDGWEKLSGKHDDKNCVLIDAFGHIHLKYVVQERDWGYGGERIAYSFWDSEDTENYKFLDEVIHQTDLLLASIEIPRKTLNTVQAMELLEKYWEKYYEE